MRSSALLVAVVGVGVLFVPFVIQLFGRVLTGGSFAMPVWVLFSCAGIAITCWVFAWFNDRPWRQTLGLRVSGAMLELAYPGFREPFRIPREAIRAVAIQVIGAPRVPRFPLFSDGKQADRWLRSDSGDLVPHLRLEPGLGEPNVAMIFSRPLKTPRAPLFGDRGPAMKGGSEILGMMLEVAEPAGLGESLGSLTRVHGLRAEDLPANLQPASPDEVATWVPIVIFGILALVLAGFVYMILEAW